MGVTPGWLRLCQRLAGPRMVSNRGSEMSTSSNMESRGPREVNLRNV